MNPVNVGTGEDDLPYTCTYQAVDPVGGRYQLIGFGSMYRDGDIPATMTLHVCPAKLDPTAPILNSDVPGFRTKACADAPPLLPDDPPTNTYTGQVPYDCTDIVALLAQSTTSSKTSLKPPDVGDISISRLPDPSIAGVWVTYV